MPPSSKTEEPDDISLDMSGMSSGIRSLTEGAKWKSCLSGAFGSKWFLSSLIVFLGIAACSTLIAVGVTDANGTSQDNFELHAKDVVFSVEEAFNDYELFGLWVHESCYKPFEVEEDFTKMKFCSRSEFRKLYEYLMSVDLDLQAAVYLPKVQHEQRPLIQAEAKPYYEFNYPTVNYQGITQLVANPKPGEPQTVPSEEKAFYYPVHLVEPVQGNEAAVELDMYSAPGPRRAIGKAISTWKPALSDRLQLPQETNPSTYSIHLFHPGTRTTVDEASSPNALSLMVIRMPDLLARATRNAQVDEEIYVYDSTYSDQPAVYLGAVKIVAKNNGGTTVEHLPEPIPSPPRKSQYYESILQVADRQWTVAVVSEDDQASNVIVIVSGVLILLACILLAWQYYRAATASDSAIPQTIQDSIIKNAAESTKEGGKPRPALKNPATLKSFLIDAQEGRSSESFDPSTMSKPIAQLFPEATLCFADIAGFTAWSSTREPTQVFTLLETVYSSFDFLAKRYRIFKVETIGDCYVAVCGLPDARKDHHVAMSRFARDCIERFASLMRRLEIDLGPDTAELGVRIGLHLGPVTCGVLRGDRPRLQLFGSTVNHCSRIESSGEKNMIHISKELADALTASNKGHWITQREDSVIDNSKGTIETFWLDPKRNGGKSSIRKVVRIADSDEAEQETTNANEDTTNANEDTTNALDIGAKVVDTPAPSVQDLQEQKIQRLVDWNKATLIDFLKAIVARRNATNPDRDSDKYLNYVEKNASDNMDWTLLDETVEVLELPKFDATAAQKEEDRTAIVLSDAVEKQLHDYILTISRLYHANPFHNFEHASHVIMSSVKLLRRIVAPEMDFGDNNAKSLHDHTYGITSDPLTQFAIILSALIHDVDHQGVPNAQLVKEGAHLAQAYGNKSVAEQNSLDLAWALLMDDMYKDLRRTIYTNEEEFKRFRQLMINTVLATDVMDKELGAFRKKRWDKAFSEGPAEKESPQTAVNRKATIVLEYLIQASDVSHTMQHWHIYRRWNARLFEEMYLAYKEGRAEKNPAEFWFKGEQGFLDFYVIPMAKKLKTCGVFGVSSDEYLNYVLSNRDEWEVKGQELVAKMVEALEPKEGSENGEL